ncbi:MAG: DUF4421 domain-containing protein [Prevotellaceae bacterium]|jgi:hypothetical protein|nr:DUF4421 domain-containing protein [Prevotellaceae bacterium]
MKNPVIPAQAGISLLQRINGIPEFPAYAGTGMTPVFLITTKIYFNNNSKKILTKYFAFILTFFVCADFCAAQTDSVAYVEPYNQIFGVKAYTSRDFININNFEKSYKPNNPMKIGLGISIKSTILDLSYGLGIGSSINKEAGKTKSFDLQLHHYRKYLMFDLFFQQYKGFYSEEKGKIELFPDIAVRYFGFQGNYVPKGNKFSARAAFAQKEKQLKSAGSFIVGGGLYLEALQNFTGGKFENNFQLGANVGYAYSWVIIKDLLLSAEITAGVQFGNELKDWFKARLEMNPTNLIRASLAYSRKNWTLSIYAYNNTIFHFFPNNNMLNLNSGSMQIVYLYRFDLPFVKESPNLKWVLSKISRKKNKE